jgi:ubiquinone/menaquinone biosynthesis C-methylase UbiE
MFGSLPLPVSPLWGIGVLGGGSTGNNMPHKERPPVCDYEGSDYQTRFWNKGGREYEDRSESIAIKRLLPNTGRLLLELGAGAGRNTLRYSGFERIVLLDYSRTQLKQAQELLGESDRFIYVAADIYRLPFVDGLFDGATMIRVLHHMADAPAALRQVRNVLCPGACFILEFANKRNLKSILRYLLHLQPWNPFTPESVEFAPLNFDFHPRTLRKILMSLGFRIERTLAVSYFRIGLLKRTVPPALLAGLDSIFQWTGALGHFSPSVFLRARVIDDNVSSVVPKDLSFFFKCPECGHSPLVISDGLILCPTSDHRWNITGGIYDFRGDEP